MNARKLKPEGNPRRAVELTPDQIRFVDALGLLYESMGVPRIGGRMLGLFLIAERPLTAEQIADVLEVSRASVSTNLRLFLTSHLCEQVPVPGDRRHHYVMSEDAFATSLESRAVILQRMAAIFGQGLRALPPGRNLARRRLQEAADYCIFMDQELAGMARRWRTRRSR